MSSLIPERPIAISPSLATTIGLEEAVLLQLLNDVMHFRLSEDRQGYQWLTIPRAELLTLLPFWSCGDLQRISESLNDKGVILIDSEPRQHGDYFSFAMNEPTEKRPTANPQTAALQYPEAIKPEAASVTSLNQPPIKQPTSTHRTRSRGATLLTDDWQPDEDLLQLLALNHAIPRDFALQQREDFVLYWRDRQQVSHSWPSKFRQHALKEWRFHQSREANTQRVKNHNKDLTGQWAPSQDALEILQRTGISHDFIEDAVAEFVLYWRERGEVSSTWNSKFIAHIRRQWAKYTKAMELDYEPRQIAANWQPNEDVYDILRLANIELDFARQLVPEFVLFWRDTKEIQRSWNTKSLQHTKYQWATRHHMNTPSSGQRHAGQSIANQSANATNELKQNPFQQLTDRSWAQGIVEDV